MGFVRRRVLKSGRVRYYPLVSMGDSKISLGGFSCKKDAVARLRLAESQIAAGTFGKQKDILFRDFADKWLKEYASVSVKGTTLKEYSKVVRTYLKPQFGTKNVSGITPSMIQSFISSLDLSPRTINKILAVLKNIMKHAEMWGYVNSNPAKNIKRVKESRKEMSYLNPNEAKLFLDNVNPRYHALFATAILTGLRQGELLALRWSDYNGKTLCVRRTLTPAGFTDTKTGKIRNVDVTPHLAKILSDHESKGDLIFTNKDGNPVRPANLVKREFLPALERAGLKRIRFHDLRHTYAALMLSIGANIKYIQVQMGHTSITTTLDRYGHLLPSVSEGLGDKLDGLIF